LVRIVAPTPEAIAEAAGLLREGQLVAFPTETVYGLGGVATNDAAVARIFAAKGRPAHNPLIAHLADPADLPALAEVDERAERLARRFWPGPLTLVLRQKEGSPISRLVTAGLPTIAVRVPGHAVAQALLREVKLPVAAPSANPSGRVSPTTAGHVAADLGEAVAMVLDGGACPVGVESTVLDVSEPGVARLLRPGGLARDEIEDLVGPLAEAGPGGPLRAPGQLASHYAPRLPIRLDAEEVAADEALLAFGPRPPPGGKAMLNLSPTGDLEEAARNLFAMLRELDASGARGIAVMPIPRGGLGEAIRDRLRRAAAPRPADP
jgi:L-threonylcarbamoyladenylate synthase